MVIITKLRLYSYKMISLRMDLCHFKVMNNVTYEHGQQSERFLECVLRARSLHTSEQVLVLRNAHSVQCTQ